MTHTTLISDLQDRILFNLEQQGIYDDCLARDLTSIVRQHSSLSDVVQALPYETVQNSDLMFSIRRALTCGAYDLYNSETQCWEEDIIESVQEDACDDAPYTDYSFSEQLQAAVQLLNDRHHIVISEHKDTFGQFGTEIYDILVAENMAYVKPGCLIQTGYKICLICRKLKPTTDFAKDKDTCELCKPSRKVRSTTSKADFKVVASDDMITYQSMVTDYLSGGYTLVSTNIIDNHRTGTTFYATMIRR